MSDQKDAFAVEPCIDPASWGRLPTEIILRCWEDPHFLEELRKSPREILARHGLVFESSMEVRILENTSRIVHLVVPDCPEPLRHLDPQTLTPDKW